MLEIVLSTLTDPTYWAALISLTALEIVLGIDNIVFISVIVSKLEGLQAERARKLGLLLALVFRIVFLLLLTWIIGLQVPIFEAFGKSFSWRDVILVGGGLFLIVKAIWEIHNAIDGDDHQVRKSHSPAFSLIVMQIVLVDVVFSLDSIITAIGMTSFVSAMILAVLIAMAIMYLASGAVSRFIRRHPTTKMLALAFLILIGISLFADGLGTHFERAYIYFAMGFAAVVETFNVLARRNRRPKQKTEIPKPVRSSENS